MTQKQKRSFDDLENAETTQETDEKEERQLHYWLMKAEPDTRFVNGTDIAFDYEMLEELTKNGEYKAWGGVRNYEARNMIKSEMKLGDLVFFYYSNCKPPRIAGVMEICREAFPEANAFNKENPYYDPKSDPERPRWFSIGVKAKFKLKREIPLHELRMYSNNQLANMESLKRSRLSVSRVSPREWQFILDLAEQASPDATSFYIKKRRKLEEHLKDVHP
ncbi:DUF55 family protein [Schizosaccharomyces japonicus yFS275]|uniref:DUF55 family protein n=1 Tax=Schizosaccharomyces japonicus (strain yFS275 / FY16936) TaxID=402676 RepID=B6K4Q9_SCHJY|nr:DUF55 family protein [Schizosaccharomyces japonicus yFS275]EEB08466.1 DUF55 family protein [Schizosaccharomyces japonicus yFS275]